MRKGENVGKEKGGGKIRGGEEKKNKQDKRKLRIVSSRKYNFLKYIYSICLMTTAFNESKNIRWNYHIPIIPLLLINIHKLTKIYISPTINK